MPFFCLRIIAIDSCLPYLACKMNQVHALMSSISEGFVPSFHCTPRAFEA